jgi:hypothetical protein
MSSNKYLPVVGDYMLLKDGRVVKVADSFLIPVVGGVINSSEVEYFRHWEPPYSPHTLEKIMKDFGVKVAEKRDPNIYRGDAPWKIEEEPCPSNGTKTKPSD